MARAKTVVTRISKITDRPAPGNSALVVIYGEDLGRKYDLDREVTVIGRSSKCHISVNQDSISRNHARILVDDKGAAVHDMGSTNGTFVNDEAVDGMRRLRNGDFIKIGRMIFKYIEGGNIEGQYHEEIYRLTTIDGLTEIANKRIFLETIEREFSRSRRYERSLSLAMIDIDRFKRVNDAYGHLAGDHVLKTLANAIKPKIRREDVFARYGGEEFALILPEIDLNGAVLTAEKLRRIVEEEKFEFDSHVIPVTISLGVSTMSPKMEGPEALIKAADEKLYEAKRAGRNRVMA